MSKVRIWWESYHVEGFPSYVPASKLKLLKENLKLLNVTVFGQVGVQKHTLLADLGAIDELALLRPLSKEEKERWAMLASSLECLLFDG